MSLCIYNIALYGCCGGRIFYTLLYLLYCSSIIKGQFIPCLKQLVQDGDVDVQYFATEALTIINVSSYNSQRMVNHYARDVGSLNSFLK